MAIERIQPGPRMSQAVIHGNTVYVAGQVAANPVPSVARQTKQILGQIDKLLKAAGTSKAKLLSANVWLTDYIARIDLSTGRVVGYIDLKGLLPAGQNVSQDAVLNGIAYDAAQRRLFVTGKNWPKLFEIELKKK